MKNTMTPRMAYLVAVCMSREQLNDWYKRIVGYSPDEDIKGETPINELRDMIAEMMLYEDCESADEVDVAQAEWAAYVEDRKKKRIALPTTK